VVHDAEVACAFLVDIAPRAVPADRIGADSTVVLSEEVGEVPQADDAVGLPLVGVLLSQLHLYLMWEVPGRVRLTTFWPPPTMKDRDCGSSLFMEEAYMDSKSSASLFLRRIIRNLLWHRIKIG
jgi:hypothetical protein